MSKFFGLFMFVFQIKGAGVQKGSLHGKTKSMKPYLILSSAIATMEKKNTLFNYELTVFPTVLEKKK